MNPDNQTFIDELLTEQRRLTAVERFAQRHANGDAQAKFYRDLIPLNKPKPGEQYAFEVDLDKCTGCKACVSACHSLNGLDDDEMWRSVGLLVGLSNRITQDKFVADSPPVRSSTPYLQTVTTACHHCVDPGCLNGCPVLAYDKDPHTGIVRHLDDQCIGCQYCVMKCPYEVPKFSSKRGIVRKCDMCHDRLAVGEAPACVQACPSEAIRITVVNQGVVRAGFASQTLSEPVNGNGHSFSVSQDFLADSPDPRITLPTTRYKSSKPLPSNLLAGDHTRVLPAESHLPLVFMLVLTQLAVGVSVAATVVNSTRLYSLVTVVVSTIALGIASLHLGKPLKAWRAFLGWRKSWFSREVILFSAFVPLAATTVALPDLGLLKVLAALMGMLGVACSAMIYADTKREFWNARQSFGKFIGSTVLLGASTTLVLQMLTQSADARFPVLTLVILIVATVAKLSFENRIFNHCVDENTVTLTQLNRTARLMEGGLGLSARLRVGCGIFGGLLLPLFMLANHTGSQVFVAALALALCIAGELLERYLFFAAVAPARMPGGVAE